jgi:hypothetical protein
VSTGCLISQGKSRRDGDRERVERRYSGKALTLLQEGGVDGLGGSADGGSALGETRDVAKSVHGTEEDEGWMMEMRTEQRDYYLKGEGQDTEAIACGLAVLCGDGFNELAMRVGNNEHQNIVVTSPFLFNFALRLTCSNTIHTCCSVLEVPSAQNDTAYRPISDLPLAQLLCLSEGGSGRMGVRDCTAHS